MRSCKAIRVRSFAALFGLLLASSGARAQEPDVRDIAPFVMLVVDTSASMEDLPACCTPDGDCSNCRPDCELPNDENGETPKDSNGRELKKNRWAMTLESLTGKFVDFECTALKRDVPGTYDYGASTPYHQPWRCSSGERCDYPGPSIQLEDGILDAYSESLHFGLMTFDGENTIKNGNDLVNETDWNLIESLANDLPGMWSYGSKRPFRYPGCDEVYYINSGVRGPNATEGGLISLGSTTCPDKDCDQLELNAEIQASLLRTRPYAGTPIAGALSDLYEHLKNDVTDDYGSCRARYAILITDGEPDPEFRHLRCACGDENTMESCGTDADGNPYDGKDFFCPYPVAADLAKQLVEGDGTASNPKQIEKLFVLGMSIQTEEEMKELDKIADAGKTTRALKADDPNTLRATLDSVFSPLLNPISRSVPGFATGFDGTQYQISTGFQVTTSSLSTSTAPPWTGLIERRKFVCNATTGLVETPDLEDEDRFHKVINSQSPEARTYYTAVPSAGTPTIDMMRGPLVKGSAECPDGCKLTDIDSTNVPASLFGVAEELRKETVDWMYGRAAVRSDRKLADIYHSSPTIVGPPVEEPTDDAYASFRDLPEVKERPLVMYIATNDGVLHAISVEDYPHAQLQLTKHANDMRLPFKAGEELWGFVPPMLIPKLNAQLTKHQFNLDATPVVKDVFFKREGTAEETEYRTVLIMGMRGGGNGYFALDVTDPMEPPKFLWQFTDEKDMGLTYGQPEIVQATFKFAASDSETETLQTRAVAILPGGKGKASSSSGPGCSFGKTLSRRMENGDVHKSWTKDDPAADRAGHRPAVQCWERTGRALFFVDVETGRLIKKIFDTDDSVDNGIWFPSPIVGTPTAYPDAIGTNAERGFVIDQDGVLWRIDMSSQDVEKDDPGKGWTVRPFHDLFYDKTHPDFSAKGGETTYEKPILSLDEKRRLVVLLGTGDTDDFEKSQADNRIVSLTEVTSTDTPKYPEDYHALVNWELRNEGKDGDGRGLYPGELVTGAMALFDGQLFISTFISNAGTSDMCEYGRGRLWSVHYNLPDDTHDYEVLAEIGIEKKPATKGPLVIPVETDDDATDSDAKLFNVPRAKAAPNVLIQGLGTTQRSACAPDDIDPLSSYFAPHLTDIQQTEQPAIWVVAQASSGNKRAGSGLGGVQAKVARRISFSRIASWATSVD